MLRALAAVALLLLAACGGADNIYADDAAVMRARFVPSGPPSITLYTVITKRTGGGAHSALLVNGSESVLFDPAGSFQLQRMPERGDALYGASPLWMNAYIDYHARETHDVQAQTLQVSPAVAEALLNAIKTNGAVPKANCANSISRILGQTPGFESIGRTFFPNALARDFGALSGVSTRFYTDQTVDKSHGVNFIDRNDRAALEEAGLAP